MLRDTEFCDVILLRPDLDPFFFGSGSGESEPGSATREGREDPVPNTTTIPRLVTPPDSWLVGLGSYTLYIHISLMTNVFFVLNI